MKNEIIIIGTLPPCPRCSLLTEIMERKVKALNLEASVRHIAYTSEEAAAIANSQGLVPGTAKDVAKRLGTEIRMEDLQGEKSLDEPDFPIITEEELLPLNQLFRQVHLLDIRLRPYEHQAEKAGILMTPVLVINGEIMHAGSVPALEDIQKWISGS